MERPADAFCVSYAGRDTVAARAACAGDLAKPGPATSLMSCVARAADGAFIPRTDEMAAGRPDGAGMPASGLDATVVPIGAAGSPVGAGVLGRVATVVPVLGVLTPGILPASAAAIIWSWRCLSAGVSAWLIMRPGAASRLNAGPPMVVPRPGFAADAYCEASTAFAMVSLSNELSAGFPPRMESASARMSASVSPRLTADAGPVQFVAFADGAMTLPIRACWTARVISICCSVSDGFAGAAAATSIAAGVAAAADGGSLAPNRPAIICVSGRAVGTAAICSVSCCWIGDLTGFTPTAVMMGRFSGST